MMDASRQAGRARERSRRAATAAGEVVRSASVRVAEPAHLCRVQASTRELCRSIGLSEGDVFSAVIAVTERVHSFFIEGARTGQVELALIRRKTGLGLEVRTKPADHGPAAGAGLAFLPVAGPRFG